jgi:hypothetical protein
MTAVGSPASLETILISAFSMSSVYRGGDSAIHSPRLGGCKGGMLRSLCSGEAQAAPPTGWASPQAQTAAGTPVGCRARKGEQL